MQVRPARLLASAWDGEQLATSLSDGEGSVNQAERTEYMALFEDGEDLLELEYYGLQTG